MIISVDTVKDAPAELRAAAALILSVAAEREGSVGAQHHPFPPVHENHPHEAAVRAHVADEPPAVHRVPPPNPANLASATGSSSRRIADLLAEVSQQPPEDDEDVPVKQAPREQQPPEDKPIIRRIPPGVQVY